MEGEERRSVRWSSTAWSRAEGEQGDARSTDPKDLFKAEASAVC